MTRKFRLNIFLASLLLTVSTFASIATAAEICTSLTTRNDDGSYGILCDENDFCGYFVPTDARTDKAFLKLSKLQVSENSYCFETSKIDISGKTINFAFSPE